MEILSGTFEGKTLGTPISMWVRNEDARPEAYSEMAAKFRPSHADYTYQAKFGIRNWQGGGRTSARETIGRVAAGAVARKILREQFRVGDRGLRQTGPAHRGRSGRGQSHVATSGVNIVRCPDRAAGRKMIRLIERMRRAGDSVGGMIECVARGVPPGWGEPVFDRLEADLAKAMLSLPASKGFEIGSGFGGILMTGREHNDLFRMRGGKVRTVTNNSGGIQGGISNGENVIFRVAFKPVATVMHEQETVDVHFKNTTLQRPRPP